MAEYTKFETFFLEYHVKDFIFANDKSSIRKFFDAMGIEKGATKYFSDDARTALGKALTYASIAAAKKELAEDLALELIEYSATVVDICSLLYAMLCYIGYRRPDTNADMPDWLANELRQTRSSKMLSQFIYILSLEQYLLVISHIVNIKSGRLKRDISVPLLVYAYQRQFISPDLFFAYFWANLAPIDNPLRDVEAFSANDVPPV